MFDRGYHPDGTARQIAAIALPRPDAGARPAERPDVVIHGSEDPLITRSGGEATAAAIEDAELVVIDGMGHDMPPRRRARRGRDRGDCRACGALTCSDGTDRISDLNVPTDEQLADVNGIEIVYDEIGDRDGEPLVLIMGLATQMIHWDLGFCGMLAERGYRVIRFDNRDIGRSSKSTRRFRARRRCCLASASPPTG